LSSHDSSIGRVLALETKGRIQPRIFFLHFSHGILDSLKINIDVTVKLKNLALKERTLIITNCDL